MAESKVTEELRLATLAEYRVVGSVPDSRFDAIISSLASACGAAMAKIVFVDSQFSWVKDSNSSNFQPVPRSISFCAKYVVEPVRTIIEPDLSQASNDLRDRLAAYTNASVSSVAGVPLAAPNGAAIGALLVLDTKPRDFTMTQVESLTRTARKVMELLESIRAAYELAGGNLEISDGLTDDSSGIGLTGDSDSTEIAPLVDNSHAIVEEFVADNLTRSGWWAAQIWWADDDQLFPEPWIIDASAPEVITKLRSRSGAVPIPFGGVEYARPTLVDIESAPWLGNLANISQAGVRHLMILDISGALTTSLRLVFVVPEGVRVKPETISALETGALLLPRVLRQEQARGELLYRSTHDALTGLLNRRGLDQVIAPLEGARAEQLHAVMYLDLDHFKQVNDNQGHAVGDQLLKHVATQILRQMRPTDSVVRLGGDEFVVLATNIGSTAAAYNLGRRLLQALNGSFTAENGVQLKVAASIGVAIWRSGAMFDDALKVADALMYQAKQAGGALAVEELAGSTNPDSNTHIGVSRDDLRLLTVLNYPLLESSSGKTAGQIVTVESPLRALSPVQVADEITALLTDIPKAERRQILLRFSNHFWNHGRLIPQLGAQLRSRFPESRIRTLIDSSLIGSRPSEAIEAVAADSESGLVIMGLGRGPGCLDMLDLLNPQGLAIGGDFGQSGMSKDGVSKSLTAAIAIAKALGIELYAIDQSAAIPKSAYADFGFDFYCRSTPIKSTTNQGE